MFKSLEDIYEYKKDITIFDIGAYNFNDSIEFITKCPKADIYAFEPDIDNLSMYSQNASNKGVVVCECAMGDKKGKIKFYPSSSLNGVKWTASGSIIEPATRENSSEGINHDTLFFDLEGKEIECTTVKDFCKENNIDNVHYMHIDAQGSEYKILNNLGNIRPLLIKAETCEWTTYKTGINLEIFDQLMKDLGYSVLERYQYDTIYTHKTNV